MKNTRFGIIGCCMRINGMYSLFNSAEQILADYILANAESIIHMTIDQLSKNSGVSTSTIHRFCKKLDIVGFKEFRKSLIADIANQATKDEIDVSEYEISRGGTTQQICEITLRLFNTILNDCANLLDVGTLDKAVSMLLSARMIKIIGTGASAASALYAHTRFLRLGIPCSFSYDPTVYLMESSMMKERDVLFAISSSGRTSTVVDAAVSAKKSGAVIISLSDYSVSPLQQCSDINLFTTTRNVGRHLSVDMPLTISQIAIIDIVYACCSMSLGDLGRTNYLKTKSAADSTKSKQ